jgi:hypothetical protein
VRDALVLACAAEIGASHVKVADIAEATARRLPAPLGLVTAAAAVPSAALDMCLLGIAGSLAPSAQPWR